MIEEWIRNPAFVRLSHVLSGMSRSLLDLVYPPQCIGCGKAVDHAAGLCPSCWSGMRFITRPFCERLGTPFAVDLGGKLYSPAAIADPPVFNRARAVAAYDGPARDLVHKLKFGDQLSLAKPMAELMRQAGAELLKDADALIPVPAHRWRMIRRRFNQTVVLARELSRLAEKPLLDDVLIKHRATAPQTSLSRAQRRDNISGAMRISTEKRYRVEGKTILLIDDVLTTGSTANAASRILLRAGARAVDVLTFATVVQSV
jgi:ComF family protein